MPVRVESMAEPSEILLPEPTTTTLTQSAIHDTYYSVTNNEARKDRVEDLARLKHADYLLLLL